MMIDVGAEMAVKTKALGYLIRDMSITLQHLYLFFEPSNVKWITVEVICTTRDGNVTRGRAGLSIAPDSPFRAVSYPSHKSHTSQ
jgi:hypothetical protein